MADIPLEDIDDGDRIRQSAGDVSDLMRSIEAVGLLHPVVVTAEKRLVSGLRRLEAFRQLGRTKIPVRTIRSLSDAVDLLVAERDENTCRKDFTPSEAVAMGEALEALERPAAEQRKGRGRPPKTSSRTSGNFPEDNGRARDKVGAALGMSGKTYEKAKDVVESGDEELIEKMDRTGKVDAAYKAFKKKQKAKAEAKARKRTSRAKRKDFNSVCDIRTCSCAALFASEIEPDVVIADPPYSAEQGDAWADAHRCLGPTFNMQDLDASFGIMAFGQNSGERLFLEYVPDNYSNRQNLYREFRILALFDRKLTEAAAKHASNTVSRAFYMWLARSHKARFFYVIGGDAPPWTMVETETTTGREIGKRETIHSTESAEWKRVWLRLGLSRMRAMVRQEVDPR